jgi:hypothetical protein
MKMTLPPMATGGLRPGGGDGRGAADGVLRERAQVLQATAAGGGGIAVRLGQA